MSTSRLPRGDETGAASRLPNSDEINTTIEALKRNGFDVRLAEDIADAERIFWEEIFDRLRPNSVSWGDSMTLLSTNIIPALRKNPEIELIETFSERLDRVEIIRNRKRALTCDLFLTGTNAVTSKGQLVNLDMTGNRIAGITFGPENVVLFIGVNKIVRDIEQAMNRVRTVSAPMNVKRHEDFNTPCRITGKCADCRSPQRICNMWAITEKCYPEGRIKIILINRDLGL